MNADTEAILPGQREDITHRTSGPLPATGTAIHRPKRTVRQKIVQAPGDWVLDRSRVPGLFIGWTQTGTLVALVACGFPLGQILAATWLFNQIPVTTQFIRMIIINVRNGIKNPLRWDYTWWTRPQAHQRKDVASGVEPPLGIQLDPTAFVNPRQTLCARYFPGIASKQFIGPLLGKRHPWSTRKLLRVERLLVETSDRKDRPVRALLSRQVDNLFSERARVPGFYIGVGQLAAGMLLGLPFLANFLTNMVVTYVPTMTAMFLAWQTGDSYRFTRPGTRQRITQLPMTGIEHKADQDLGREALHIDRSCAEAFDVPSVDVQGVALHPGPRQMLRGFGKNLNVPLRRIARNPAITGVDIPQHKPAATERSVHHNARLPRSSSSSERTL